jgi:DNA (cytosine-5)-methyltransferase 1
VSLRVGSLFSGIGGFDLGLERAGGFHTAWFCEQDEFCQHVLAQHWPGVPCYPDITQLRGADVEPVDVLCGGFPCQDLSYAGAGAGLAGARSGLWSEYARLIGELRPRYVVVENVSALLARGLGVVLGDLAALGYDAEWDCIPASAVGAPHQRDRIWLVAYPSRDLQAGPAAPGSERQRARPSRQPGGARANADADPGCVADARRERVQPERAAREVGGAPREREGEEPERQRLRNATRGRREGLADAGSARLEGRRDGRPAPDRAGEVDYWAVEPDVGRVAHGVPARVDRLRSLGNALVPAIATWIGERIIDYERGVESLAA